MYKSQILTQINSMLMAFYIKKTTNTCVLTLSGINYYSFWIIKTVSIMIVKAFKY